MGTHPQINVRTEMAKTDYKTIDEYQKTFSGEIAERLQRIREIVHQISPEAEELISYQIPSFKMGKKYLIYYSAYTNHISVSSPWSNAFLKRFQEDLKKYKVTKSAIHFPNNQPLPVDLLAEMIEFRKDECQES